MKRHIVLLLEYDGTDYAGWQRQRSLPTIQGTLENVLSQILNERVVLRGSSRTDAGVHALGQVAAFETKNTIPLETLQRAANALLPSSIVIADACEVEAPFSPLRDAIRKTYVYCYYNGFKPSPFISRYVWAPGVELDCKVMKQAAALWKGRRDFRMFMNSGSRVKTTVRTVERIEVHAVDEMIFFLVTADGFLKQMVRNMAGTLVMLLRGKVELEHIRAMQPPDPKRGFRYTAPAKGLCLLHIEFRRSLPLSFRHNKIVKKMKEWWHE